MTRAELPLMAMLDFMAAPHRVLRQSEPIFSELLSLGPLPHHVLEVARPISQLGCILTRTTRKHDISHFAQYEPNPPGAIPSASAAMSTTEQAGPGLKAYDRSIWMALIGVKRRTRQ
jgi:hypothetical protein